MTIWGDQATNFESDPGQVMAFKNCRVSDYLGKSLNASNDISDFITSLKHPRVYELQKWYAIRQKEGFDKIKPLSQEVRQSGI